MAAGLDYAGMAQLDPVALTEGALYAAETLAGPICQLLVNSFSGGGSSSSGGANGSSATEAGPTQDDSEVLKSIDTEQQRRAYETVNYVLRNFGSRISEIKLIDAVAMNRALTNASEHIEVRLFSPDMNLLFRSLQSRMNDVVLLRSVFASIYLLGALSAELSSSLPNYKDKYEALGPLVVCQFFLAAIGKDAYNLEKYEKEKAFKTLAATSGLLRPTDIGYSIFPGFPNFSPSTYSSSKFGDTRSSKSSFNKLKKLFETHGFPQPLPGHDVGGIADWRFLSGDSNDRNFEIGEDKAIGENFGKVVYWLICSASRMPTDRAVIVYHDQHRELVRWLGKRAGFRVLTAADLDLSLPAHSKLDTKAAAVFHSWVIIMAPLVPDVIERAPIQVRPPPPQQYNSAYAQPYPSNPGVQNPFEKPPLQTHNTYPPQGYYPHPANQGPDPNNPATSPSSGIPPAYSPPHPAYSTPVSPAGTTSPGPGYGPTYPPGEAPGGPTELPQKRFTIRRKAPPAPRPVTSAKALYDFMPEADDPEGLAFRAGEVLEISDKMSRIEDGWWIGKIRGGDGRIGLIPATFCTEEETTQFRAL